MSSTITIPRHLAYPGPDFADEFRGGWVKRASVPASRLPHHHGDQRPCPTNGHMAVGLLRNLACTAHERGWHVCASLGRVLAVWPDAAGGGR